MTIIRLIYLVVIVTVGVFVIMYPDPLSLLLLLVVLAMPLLLFLMLVLARILTKITVDPPETVATKGQAVPIRFRIRNFSFVALPAVRATVTYTGAFSEEVERTEFTFPLHALTKQTTYCDIKSDHVGVVKVRVGDIYLSDYLRLFTFKIKIRQEYEITFLPEITPVSMEFRPNTLIGTDSDVFSKTKKGDDPSEVFAIRDYVGGDKLNRIHWKLSSKQDNLMVKDYSLPINNNIVIIPELASTNKETVLDDIDTIIETTVAISHFLCEADITHYIGWYDSGSERFFNEEIKNADDMFTTLGFMLNSTIGNDCDSMVYWKKDRPVYSHVAYISAIDDAAVIKYLGEMSYSTYYSMIRVGDVPAIDEASGMMQFLRVKHNKVADALNGFVL